MKDLFLTVSMMLEQITHIKSVDDDSGQIDNYEERPAIALPCCLILIDQIFQPLGGGAYDVSSSIQVRVAFDRLGDRTVSGTPNLPRLKSLEKIDIVEQITDALNGLFQENVCSPLILQSLVSERRNDGLMVKVITLTETHEQYP